MKKKLAEGTERSSDLMAMLDNQRSINEDRLSIIVGESCVDLLELLIYWHHQRNRN